MNHGAPIRPAPDRTIPVRIGPRGYEVRVGAGLLGRLGPLVTQALPAPARQALLVFDAALPSATIDAASASLAGAGLIVSRHAVHAAEQSKTIGGVGAILTAAASSRHERADPIIALGGGVVGDMAGFAAAIYRRGVPVVQCPTTLLSMVDASVGGKTGVNLDLGTVGEREVLKNLVGAFHQPVAVVADTDTLRSLPPRHFRSGLAECVKHGLIGAEAGDPGLLDWIGSNVGAVLGLEPTPLADLLVRNIALKARIVETDEREEAEAARVLLNLGHTFAHALEPLAGLSPDSNPSNAPLQHGEAVALGLVAACELSRALGLADASFVDQTRSLLSRAGLPVRVRGLPSADALIARMAHDKKATGGAVRFIVPTPGCRARVVRAPDPGAVAAALDAIRG